MTQQVVPRHAGMTTSSTLPALPRWLVEIVIISGVATAGIERVDLLAGAGPLNLSPFLVVAPVLVACAIYNLIGGADPTNTFLRSGRWLVFIFLMLSVLSVTFSPVALSAGRALLLVVNATAAWSIYVLVRGNRYSGALWRGAAAGLLIYILFDALLAWRFVELGSAALSTTTGFVDLRISPLGEGIARFAGASLDANRAAIVVAVYTYLLIGRSGTPFRKPVWAILIAIIGLGLVLVTSSRSGLAAYVVILFGVAIWLIRSASLRARIVMLGSVVVGLVAAGVFVVSSHGAVVFTVLERRLSSSDGSTSTHFELIQRALESLSLAPQQPWFGLGYGSAFTLLNDYFPGNTYGNFHAVFATVLVEVGVFGLTAFIALSLIPVVRSDRWLALGLFVFGIFYQSLADPVFWLALGLLWLDHGPRAGYAVAEGTDENSRLAKRPRSRELHSEKAD